MSKRFPITSTHNTYENWGKGGGRVSPEEETGSNRHGLDLPEVESAPSRCGNLTLSIFSNTHSPTP